MLLYQHVHRQRVKHQYLNMLVAGVKTIGNPAFSFPLEQSLTRISHGNFVAAGSLSATLYTQRVNLLSLTLSIHKNRQAICKLLEREAIFIFSVTRSFNLCNMINVKWNSLAFLPACEYSRLKNMGIEWRNEF